jgi:DNA-directed RNA polymerase subunit omega
LARITVEDSPDRIANRFELVGLVSKRAKQLFRGAKPLLVTDNREIVTALREITEGKVRRQIRLKNSQAQPLSFPKKHKGRRISSAPFFWTREMI